MNKDKRRIALMLVACLIAGGVLYSTTVISGRVHGLGRSLNNSTPSYSTESSGSSSGSGSSYKSDSSSDSSYKSKSSSESSYNSNSSTKGAGGYDMPNENDESFSDYVKRVDPDLYDSMNDNYNDAVKNSGSSEYDKPKSGESFSDYMKRVDPDLYDTVTNRYNTITGQ